jgi:hypothetical protein
VLQKESFEAVMVRVAKKLKKEDVKAARTWYTYKRYYR